MGVWKLILRKKLLSNKTKIIDFYKGFEGYPEIHIFHKDSEENLILLLKLWEGYFDSIIRLIEPNSEGYWEGFALDYHTFKVYDVWGNEEPWKCEDKNLLLTQLKQIETENLDKETVSIHQITLKMIKDAIDSENEIYIYRD